MANDDTQVDDAQVDNIVDDNQTDDTEVDITKQSDSDFMTDTVDQIKDTQKVILDNDDTTVDDKGNDDLQDDSGIITELAGNDIPDVYSEAAEASGMTQNDIIKYADSHTDEELIEEAAAITEALKVLDEVETDNDKSDDKVDKQDNKTDKDNDNEDIDPKLIESITEKISKQLEEKFGATLKDIDKFKADQEEQSNKQTIDTASKLFDEASKESPVFGKTDELPRFPSGRLAGQLIPTSPAMKARLEVLKYAGSFMGSGLGIDGAMENALATYKGLHLTKEVERNVIKNLKAHERTLSGARVGKETKKKYADSRDEIIDDIRQMQRESGID